MSPEINWLPRALSRLSLSCKERVGVILILIGTHYGMLNAADTRSNETEQSAKQQPQRVISAGGSITEILHHLGVSQQFIAIDTSSQYPESIQHLPKVGYFRSLSAEGLLSLRPSLLVAAKGAGPAAVLQQLESVGVTVKLFDQIDYSLESWKSIVQQLGEYFDKTANANTLVASVSKNIAQVKREQSYPNQSINVISLLSIGQRGPMIAGQKTMPNFLFEQAGLKNLGESIKGYKPINNEALIAKKLDLIFIPSHMEKAMGGKQAICSHAVIKLALRSECQVIVMDSLLLMGMGARIDLALAQIIEAANQVEFINQ